MNAAWIRSAFYRFSRGAVCVLTAALFLSLDAAMGDDADGDGMDDDYELFFGLNTNVNDAGLNPDGDGLTNRAEEVLGTDPFSADTDQDGWNDDEDDVPLSRGVMYWGDAQFTETNLYTYTGPAWWVGGTQAGGEWQSNGWNVASGVSNDTGLLYVDINAVLLTSNLMLDVTLDGNPSGELYVDLYDTNDVVVATNLFGDILLDTNATVLLCLDLPFGVYTNAAGASLRRGTGEVLVRESVIYIDLDEDGLDGDQEDQLGTSDEDIDSDDDGVGDWTEVFARGTDPTNATSVNVTLYANADTGGDELDGLSATAVDDVRGPKESIAAAIADAVSGDEIRVATTTNDYETGVWALGERQLTLIPEGSVVAR